MMKVARLGQEEFRLPLDIVRLYHNALLISIVGYAAGVWAHRATSGRIKRQLRIAQRKVLIRVTGAFSTTPTMALFVIMGLWPLDLQIRERGALYWLKRNEPTRVREIVGTAARNEREIRTAPLREWQRYR